MGRWPPASAWCVAVPPPGPGVCMVCSAGSLRDGALCGTCRRLSRRSSVPLGVIVPISMAPEGSGIYQALLRYKATTDGTQTAWRGAVLSAMVGRFLRVHGGCLNPEGWDIACTVPSLRARPGRHPLEVVVDGALRPRWGGTRALLPLRDVLRPGPAADVVLTGTALADAFRVDRRTVEGRRVLLVDDVCTSGAHAQSARAVLVRAGARRVDTVVIGRRIRRGWPDNEQILEWASRDEHRWDSRRCARCTPEGPDEPGRPSPRRQKRPDSEFR